MSAPKTIKAILQGGPMDGHTVEFPDQSNVGFLVADPRSAEKKFMMAYYERIAHPGNFLLYQFVEKEAPRGKGDSPSLN